MMAAVSGLLRCILRGLADHHMRYLFPHFIISRGIALPEHLVDGVVQPQRMKLQQGQDIGLKLRAVDGCVLIRLSTPISPQRNHQDLPRLSRPFPARHRVQALLQASPV